MAGESKTVNLNSAGRLLLVGPGQGAMGRAAEQVRKAGWASEQADDGFAAIEAVVRDTELEAVLVDWEAFAPRSADLAATIRSARPQLPIYLICPAWLEPEARRICQSSRDVQYLIDPLAPGDVQAIRASRSRQAGTATPAAQAEPTSPNDLTFLGDLNSAMDRLTGPVDALLAAAAESASRMLGGATVRIRWLAQSANMKFPPDAPEPEQTAEKALIGPDGQQAGELVLPAAVAATASADLVAATIGRLLGLHRRMATLQQMAFTDHLSGAFNRRYLMFFLDRLIAQARDEGFRITLLMFDIDDFKKYNDTYGHSVGDEIIADIARLMRQTSRPHDVVARIGGEEFAVLLWDSGPPRQPGSRHPAEAEAFAARFTKTLAAHRFRSLGPAAQGTLTMSGGLAHFPDDADNSIALLAQAGEGLKQAKSSGKNRVYVVGQQP